MKIFWALSQKAGKVVNQMDVSLTASAAQHPARLNGDHTDDFSLLPSPPNQGEIKSLGGKEH